MSAWAGAVEHSWSLELEPPRPPTASCCLAARDGSLHLAVATGGGALNWYCQPAAEAEGNGHVPPLAAAEPAELVGHEDKVRALAFLQLPADSSGDGGSCRVLLASASASAVLLWQRLQDSSQDGELNKACRCISLLGAGASALPPEPVHHLALSSGGGVLVRK